MRRAEVSWWIGRGVWSLLDQGLFAASTFLVNVLLARRTSAHDYGAFVVAYSALQVVGQLYVGMLIDPMQVFGAGKHSARFPAYVRTLLRTHWQFTALGAAVFAAIAGAVARTGDATLAGAFAGVAVGGPFLTLSWFMRGACAARLRPELSSAAGAVNLALVLGGIHLLYERGVLSPLSAFAVIGCASAVSAGWLIMRLGVRAAPAFATADRAAALVDHRQYGRWASGAGVLNWVPTEIFYLVMPIWGGLSATAAVKAIANLILPAVQTQYVLTNVLTPSLVAVRGQPAFARILRAAAVTAAAGYCAHWLCLGVLREPLLRLLYGGRFAEHAELLWVFGAVPLVTGLGAVLTSALRALERPRGIFWAAVVSAAVALACIALVAMRGAEGVAVARVVSAAAFLAVLWSYYAAARRDGRLTTGAVAPAPALDLAADA
ncbi:hypothetical protein tb265_25790 [Gemmatimonadetes bacterium T265]|nr:hypothetical protein tb265_25790 [Gemmatimonadetes bacterium T265]